jgi:hypothetical protein
MRLRLGRVIVHELAAVDHLEDAGRHVEQRVMVGIAAFEEKHRVAAVAGEARGGDRAGRPSARDDEIIVLARHRLPLGPDVGLGLPASRVPPAWRERKRSR